MNYGILTVMSSAQKFLDFFKRPNRIFTAVLWVSGLSLLGYCIAAVVLELMLVQVRITLIIVMTLILLYAAYATALLLKLPEKVLAHAEKNKHLAKFLSNYNARTVVYACGTVLTDVCFAVFEISIGYAHGSHWFRINGFYYLFLCLVRVSVILFAARPFSKTELTSEEKRSREVRAYAGVGIAMLFLNSLLYALFDIMLAAGGDFVKHTVLIYGTGVFTFYKIVFAIGGFIKSRLSDNLVTKNIRNIGIVTALVSVLTFQTSLLATFPDTAGFNIANGTTASLVALINIALALSMIIKAYRETRKAEKAQAAAPETLPLLNGDTEFTVTDMTVATDAEAAEDEDLTPATADVTEIENPDGK